MKLSLAGMLALAGAACIPPRSVPAPVEPGDAAPNPAPAPSAASDSDGGGEAQSFTPSDAVVARACGQLAAITCPEGLDPLRCPALMRASDVGCVLAATTIEAVRRCGITCP